VATETGKVTMKPTLGLTGVTVNAMALIAPGAFLWITLQIQSAQTVPGTTDQSTALQIWPGIVFALVLAFLTAFSYSELARAYPEAGTGSCYYFAEKAFIDKEEAHHQKWGRLAKLVTGWAAHLFYWVYPGVMVAFMAILIGYIIQQLTGVTLDVVPQIAIAGIFSLVVSFIAFRGVSGSTTTALVINVIQLVALVGFSVLAIAYRLINPDQATFAHPNAASVVLPSNLPNVLLQATIAILILVGFESCTAFGAEARNPRRDIPRAVILALVIQGLLAYLVEYFAAGYSISDKLTSTATDGTVLTGFAAAAASSAPMGDLIDQIGTAFWGGGVGFALMIVTAVSVALAILGTTLSAMNTGVRITYAMAQDREMPDLLGLLHGRYATPHTAVVVMGVVSALIGALGTLSVVWLTGITLASNFGTFVLYALTCVWTIVAFASRKDFSLLKHGIIPGLGLIANLVMLLIIFGVSFIGGGDSQTESFIAIGFAGVWAVLSILYVALQNRRSGRALVAPPSGSGMTPQASPNP
jgi:basic amino acid/polyamine antiporter, APA family